MLHALVQMAYQHQELNVLRMEVLFVSSVAVVIHFLGLNVVFHVLAKTAFLRLHSVQALEVFIVFSAIVVTCCQEYNAFSRVRIWFYDFYHNVEVATYICILFVVNCQGSFGPESSCSVTCGQGVTSATYAISIFASNEGAACPYANGFQRTSTCSAPRACVGTYNL